MSSDPDPPLHDTAIIHQVPPEIATEQLAEDEEEQLIAITKGVEEHVVDKEISASKDTSPPNDAADALEN